MAKRFFEGAQHSLNYALYRPTPPKSLISEIVSNVKHRVSADNELPRITVMTYNKFTFLNFDH